MKLREKFYIRMNNHFMYDIYRAVMYGNMIELELYLKNFETLTLAKDFVEDRVNK